MSSTCGIQIRTLIVMQIIYKKDKVVYLEDISRNNFLKSFRMFRSALSKCLSRLINICTSLNHILLGQVLLLMKKN